MEMSWEYQDGLFRMKVFHQEEKVEKFNFQNKIILDELLS